MLFPFRPEPDPVPAAIPARGMRVRIRAGEALYLFGHLPRHPGLADVLDRIGHPLTEVARERLAASAYCNTGRRARLRDTTATLVEPDSGRTRGPAGAWWARIDGPGPARFVSLYPRMFRPAEEPR